MIQPHHLHGSVALTLSHVSLHFSPRPLIWRPLYWESQLSHFNPLWLSTFPLLASLPTPTHSSIKDRSFCQGLFINETISPIFVASPWHSPYAVLGEKRNTRGLVVVPAFLPFVCTIILSEKRLGCYFHFVSLSELTTLTPDGMATTKWFLDTKSTLKVVHGKKTASIPSAKIIRGIITLPSWHILFGAMAGN